MLLQYVNVLQGTLAPALLVMAFSAVLTVGEGRDRPLSAHWRAIGFIVGLLGAIVFAGLRASAVLNQRTVINFPTLIACVILDIAALVVVFRARRITSDWIHGHDDRHIDVSEGSSPGDGAGRQSVQPAADGTAHAAAVAIARKRNLALNLANLVAALAIAATTFRALPDVILRLSIFVEPGDPIFTSEMLLRALGFALGAATAIVAALIFRSMRHRSVRKPFTVALLLMVLLLLVRHVTDLAQILQAKRLIHFSTSMFLALVWSLNHERQMVIAMALVFIIPAIASIIVGFTTPASAVARFAPMLAGESPDNQAVRRARKAFLRRAKAAGVWSLVAMIGITVALTYGVAQTQKTVVLSPPEQYSLKDGVATIPFSQVEDGHLHRFEYKAKDGTVMRFIIIKKNGGAYGIGLDACENCGDAGYYEKDGKIICKKCDVAINLATIGFKGGCNPVPLPYKTGNGSITIQSADLDALSAHFQ